MRHVYVPLIKPEDVVPHLARKELHWRAGFSAQELAVAWFSNNEDVPARVRVALNTAPEYNGSRFLEGFFEREVALDTKGEGSHTDLVVLMSLGVELAVISVEGKVEEPFDKRISDWNTTPGKNARLQSLCRFLGVDPLTVPQLRYQLFHRTVAAISEAKRFHSRHALMLVHSFSQARSGLADFRAFTSMLGVTISDVDMCSKPILLHGVSLRFAWVADAVRSAPKSI